MPPHTPCTWAMTCFSTWTGPSTRRTLSLCRPPSGNATGPEKMGIAAISSSLAPDWLLRGKLHTQAPRTQKRKEEKQIGLVAGRQSDSAIVHCLMLGCAGQLVRFGYPMYLVDLGTGYPSVPRVSGMVVVIWRLLSSLNCALSVDILHALQPDEGRYAPLTRIRPPNYTVPPPSSTKY